MRSASDTDNRLTTMVFLNGAGPYHFLVDTGAERTLISSDIAAHLALPRGRKVMVEGITRGQAADLVNIERRCGEGTDPTATRSRAATAPRRLKRPIQLAVETMQHSGCCIGDIGATIHWAAAAGRSLVGRTAQYLQCRALRLSASSSRPTSAPDRGFSPS